jgi:hypothetical protein
VPASQAEFVTTRNDPGALIIFKFDDRHGAIGCTDTILFTFFIVYD